MPSSIRIKQYRTAKNSSHRLTRMPDVPFGGGVDPSAGSIFVDPSVRFQEIVGFGGAFTESAAINFYKLPAEKQSELLKAYFDPIEGIGYTLCRTHINSCDFSTGNYAYDDVAGDEQLENFSIAHDRQLLIPMIKEAQRVAPGTMRIFSAPWSPPAWMKTNGSMCGGGKLKPEYRKAWANYFCRYVEEYQKEGIPIWGLSIQNEPQATQIWESCVYGAEETREFVRDYLGPALIKHGLKDVRLMIWDHNRDIMYEWIQPILSDPEAARYVWGTAFHWYVADRFENVQITHDAFPDKHLLFTEGCQEQGPHAGEWQVGERYGCSLINDLNRWAVGWVDWNLVLDEYGGPNHVGNYCSAPILADSRTGELQYLNSFYYIGHFSRFIRPGAHRIVCATSFDELEATAFQNPNGEVVAVVLNRSEKNLLFALKVNGSVVSLESLAHSIDTYVIPVHP
jgi:glucosylceramidase